jgi:ABC-type sugar transport system ATPase subunit
VSSSPEPIVILRGVRREYPGGVTALREVDLGIGRGELVAIVGPSGSGKTTLLNVMGTLDSPSAGDVVVDGFDVDGLSDRELSALRARRIGFVFQHFHLAPGVSALDNVADGCSMPGCGCASGASARKRRCGGSGSDGVGVIALEQVEGAEVLPCVARGPAVFTIWSSSTRTVVVICGGRSR